MIVENTTIVFEIIGLGLLIAFVFYAARLLLTFKKGMLENAWKYVTIGAFFLVFGQFSLLASGAISLLNDVGTLMRFIGVICLTLGLRAHYQVWRIDNKDVVETTNKLVER